MFGKRDNQPAGALRLLLALTLIGHLLLSSAMALSGSVHETVHAHSHDADHECAATLFATGTLEGPLSIVLSAVYLRTDTEESVGLPKSDVSPLFLVGGVLEHAPPFVS